MVSARRAVGITRRPVRGPSSTSVCVLIASISGTTRCGRSRFDQRARPRRRRACPARGCGARPASPARPRGDRRRSLPRRSVAVRSPLLCPVPRSRAAARGSRAGTAVFRSDLFGHGHARFEGNAQFTRCRQCIPQSVSLRCLAHAPTALPRWLACALATVLLAGCGESEPFARLSGLMLDDALGEVSGMAACAGTRTCCGWRTTAATRRSLYRGEPARQPARARPGRGRGQHRLGGPRRVRPRWAPPLLVADTGDNGGLRHAATAYAIEEPASLEDTVLRRWSVSFRWPDGPRDCEAAFVDAGRGQGAAGFEETPSAGTVRGPAATARGDHPRWRAASAPRRRAAGRCAIAAGPAQVARLVGQGHRRRRLARRPHAGRPHLPGRAVLPAPAGPVLGAGGRAQAADRARRRRCRCRPRALAWSANGAGLFTPAANPPGPDLLAGSTGG